jgi:hypothetical protein
MDLCGMFGVKLEQTLKGLKHAYGLMVSVQEPVQPEHA